jgi:hypothetical protein
MNKYFLNFLRWITHGELPDKWLKTVHDFKQDEDNFSFKIKADISPMDWRCGYGSAK